MNKEDEWLLGYWEVVYQHWCQEAIEKDPSNKVELVTEYKKKFRTFIKYKLGVNDNGNS